MKTHIRNDNSPLEVKVWRACGGYLEDGEKYVDKFDDLSSVDCVECLAKHEEIMPYIVVQDKINMTTQTIFRAKDVLKLLNKITELEQQLKDHRESLRKSVNRSADLSEQLKKAESVIEKCESILTGFAEGGFDPKMLSLMQTFVEDYYESEYLKSRGE